MTLLTYTYEYLHHRKIKICAKSTLSKNTWMASILESKWLLLPFRKHSISRAILSFGVGGQPPTPPATVYNCIIYSRRQTGFATPVAHSLAILWMGSRQPTPPANLLQSAKYPRYMYFAHTEDSNTFSMRYKRVCEVSPPHPPQHKQLLICSSL